MSADENLPLEFCQELANLTLLNDKALWKVARSRVPVKSQRRFSQINYKQQKEGSASLTPEEIQEVEELIYQFDKCMLLRAEAAVMLMNRGYDISSLGSK
jgi:hypothetical protein